MMYLTDRLICAQKAAKAWLVRDIKQGWAAACRAFRAVFRYKLVAVVTGPTARIGVGEVVQTQDGLNADFYKGWSCWARVPERFRRHAIARAQRLYTASGLKFWVKIYGPGGTVETMELF